MFDVLVIIAPVFLLVGAGFGANKVGWFSDANVDGLMKFTLKFAIPTLLFRAVADLDLAEAFRPGLLLSFYTGAAASFTLGLLGARFIFKRSLPDAVAIGFGALFSNCFLLGVPITERAYGVDALTANFAIISIHSPFCYCVGITVMEIARAEIKRPVAIAGAVAKAMFRNALMIGLALGFLFNFSGLTLPDPVREAVDMMATAAFPAALFGMGGVLVRCEVKRSIGAAGMIAALSLLVHPAIVLGLSTGAQLPEAFIRSAVLTAAMPTGVNAFAFAQLYNRATGAAASAVMLATALSTLTIPIWLLVLRAVVPV